MTTVRHPIFARMYRRFAVAAEAKGGSAHRDELLWPLLGGGCHCTRDTLAAIGGAGFVVEEVRAFRCLRPCVVTAPSVPTSSGEPVGLNAARTASPFNGGSGRGAGCW
jgi:hypothetical protein